VDDAKRAMRKADRIIKDKRGETVPHTTGKSQISHSQSTPIQEIKLPNIKLEHLWGTLKRGQYFGNNSNPT